MENGDPNNKKRSKRSWIWKDGHFVEVANTTDQAQCTHCPGDPIIFNWAKGTSSMTNHLGREHQIFKPLKPGESDNSNKKPKFSFKDENLLNSKLVAFFGECHVPLSTVEHLAFRELFHVACPSFTVPSRSSLREMILSEGRAIKLAIQSQTKAALSPSYCADLWKSKSRDYYCAVTLQFIDKDWNLWNIPVSFAHVIGPHTADAIGTLIADQLRPFLGDGCKPFAGVIDGGDIASIRETAKQLQCEIKDNTCVCHMLNNLIKRMLNDYLEKDYLTEWRAFITKTRKSNPFKELWARCCCASLESKEEVVLQLDTPTRWSSTVVMMFKAYDVRKAVILMYVMVTQDPNFKEYKDVVPNWGKEDSEAWTLFGQLVELFLPTSEAIMLLEGEKYVTLSLILVSLCYLEVTTQDCKLKYPANENPQLHVVMEDLGKELNIFWDSLPIDTVIATILDPRTKMFHKIPPKEIDEAVKILKSEFLELARVNNSKDEAEIISSKTKPSSLDKMFGVTSKASKKMTPTQIWNTEWSFYENLLAIDHSGDPLAWWKSYERQLPNLSRLAKTYLAIPASQASCERLFSISKNDVTESRTSMLPELVEALLFVRKRKDIKDLLKLV
jgi:hypothetical protein